MLNRLWVRDIVLIESADIALGEGAPLVYAKRAYRNLGLPLEAMPAAA